jgi:hypothetical protein
MEREENTKEKGRREKNSKASLQIFSNRLSTCTHSYPTIFMFAATPFQQAAVCCFTFLHNKTFTIQNESVL